MAIRGPRRTMRHTALCAGTALCAVACASPIRLVPQLQRPPVLVGEWIDLRHTSAGDTALWVLGASGYDGAARLVADGVGGERVTRTEHRYGSWYFSGTLADTSGRAICFARRIGRDGATCVSFSLDTISAAGSSRRRLIVHGYQGEHSTSDRLLLERKE